jgi:hypothetical protein
MFLVSLIYSESLNLASRRREDAKRSNPGQENGWGRCFLLGPYVPPFKVAITSPVRMKLPKVMATPKALFSLK